MTIAHLESYFQSAQLPETVVLFQGKIITNISAFVQSHLAVFKTNGEKAASKGFHDRLMRLNELV